MWLPMRTLVVALAFASLLRAQGQDPTRPPIYAAESVVSSIHPAAPITPNGFVSIYGTDLSWNTRELLTRDLQAGYLPKELGGVHVYLDGQPVNLLYVSPGQVNFLVPVSSIPGKSKLWLARDGRRGPEVTLTLLETGPVLFQLDAETALVTHLDGSLVTKEAPAEAGEVVVIYAAGLGRTAPAQITGKIPEMPAQISARAEFAVLIDGEPAQEIVYAGITPGCPGLYQINFRVPDVAGTDPELRLVLGGGSSQFNLRLRTQLTPP
jgi:uncharacterized protein (TIGR03437 family)